jgi:glycosyltransferase involved in cell wall biosynthesis
MTRLAVLPDFHEERWPSMDLCAEMLLQASNQTLPESWTIHSACPKYRNFKLPLLSTATKIRNLERLWNRFKTYPHFLRRHAKQYDYFHLIDHSYAQLIHSLPDGKAGVFCHDLDAFRCLLQPEREPRPRWFRRMARHILTGMQKAELVFYGSHHVYEQLIQHRLLPIEKLIYAPYGPAPDFSPQPNSLDLRYQSTPFLLHVGSCIPRKRIELLLRIFAKIRQTHPELLLLQVGGGFTTEQRLLLTELDLHQAVYQFCNHPRAELAAMYRQAKLLLVTSESEGFGLPILEGLASGTRILASDIPPFREVGGEVISFAPVGEIDHWAEFADTMLSKPDDSSSLASRLQQASKFSWQAQARIIFSSFERLRQHGNTCTSST